MNDERRKKLQSLINQFSEIQTTLSEVIGEEEESLESLPESQKEGEKGEKMQEAIDNLNEASIVIDQASDYIATSME